MGDFDNIINDRLNEDDGENFPRRELNWDKLSQRLDIFEAANPQNDFDKIVNDRLNQEDGEFFPRREMNWDKLSQRLAQYEEANPLAPSVPKPVLTAVWKRWVWTSAAAALVGVSGLLLWHFNEVQSLEQRNADLAQQIATYKTAPNKMDTVLGKTISDKTGTAETSTKPVGEQTPIAAINSKKEAQSAEILTNNSNKTAVAQKETVAGFEQKQTNTPKNRQNTAVAGDFKKENDKTTDSKNAPIQRRNDRQISAMGNKKFQDALPFEKKNMSLNKQKLQLNESIAQQTPPSVFSDKTEGNRANIAKNKPNDVTLAPKEGDKTVKLGQKEIDKVETIAQKIPPSPNNRDANTVSEPVLDKKYDVETVAQKTPPSVSEPVLDKTNDVETSKTTIAEVMKSSIDSSEKTNLAVQNDNKKDETIIATDKNKKPSKRWKDFLPKGLAIGVERFYGEEMPDVRGVMPTTGNGISAEVMFAKNISLVASGDLLETHFEVGERPRRFHVRDEPKPPTANVELHRIRGEQHSRLLTFAVKYAFGQKWWAQPNVTVGHSWQKIKGYPVNYVFKNFTTGEETPVEAQVEQEKIKSLWQVGVGIEKKIKRWTFGVSAEMQNDFSNPTDPNGKSVASNFGILRGGVKFNVF